MANPIRAVWAQLAMASPLSGLARYVSAALLARIATGGSAVAIILLARTLSEQGTLAGILVACLTAPHVFGPVYGRWLDEAHDPRYILASACFLYPVTFQLAIWGLEQNLILVGSQLLAALRCVQFVYDGEA